MDIILYTYRRVMMNMSLSKLIFFSFLLATHSDAAELLINLAPKNVYFVGRGQVFKTIDSLENDKHFLLFGAGGIGKSQIAKEYAWSRSSNYDFIWWINAGQSMDSQSVDFVREWNNHAAKEVITLSTDMRIVWKNILTHLLETNKRGLIVFDDLHKKEENKPLFEEIQKTPHHVIVTTRNSIDTSITAGTRAHVKEFSREESIALLKQLSARKYNTIEELNALATLLKDYPLSLAQAFSYIKSLECMTVDQYASLYKNKQDELANVNYEVTKSNDGSFTDGYMLTTEITTLMTLEQIKKESHEALTLAELISLLDNSDIPEHLIIQLFSGDKLRASSAIANLLQYSLISKNTVKDVNLYNIHELLSDIVRSKITTGRKSFLLKISQAINNIIPNTLNQSVALLSQAPYYLNHIEKVFTESLNNKVFSTDLINIKIRQLEYVLTEQRDKNNSERIIAEIDHLLSKTWFVPPIIHARFLLMKAAFSAWMLDDFDKSNEEALEAEKYLNKQKNTRNEEMIMLYMRLSQNYVIQGDIDNSLKYADLAEDIANKDQATDINNLWVIRQVKAVTLWDKGDLKTAHLYFQKNADTKDKNASGLKKASFIDAYYARLLAADKNIEKALELANQSERFINIPFGENNYFSSVVYTIRADCFYRRGNFAAAEQNIQKSIAQLESFYPQHKIKGNRRLGYSYKIAGDIYAAKKEYQQAIEYYQKSEQMYLTGLKYQKIREVSELYTQMAKTYYDLQEDSEALKYRHKHQKLFGYGDENSVEISLYLNQWMDDQAK